MEQYPHELRPTTTETVRHVFNEWTGKVASRTVCRQYHADEWQG